MFGFELKFFTISLISNLTMDCRKTSYYYIYLTILKTWYLFESRAIFDDVGHHYILTL